ncbi:MAG: hypothetical protein JXR83_16735 [Deltaproteobacteria bacterium]|nr:hypothetical protein [Deltaproteobacteria bacterium]
MNRFAVLRTTTTPADPAGRSPAASPPTDTAVAAPPLASVADTAPTTPGRANLSSVRARLPWAIAPRRTAIWQPVDRSALKRPIATAGAAPITSSIAIGTRVEAAIGGVRIAGTLEGFDYRGRAVLLDGTGQRRIAGFDNVIARSPHRAAPFCLDALPPEALAKAPASLARAMRQALELKVNGNHTAREYIDRFHELGYEVYIVGGCVRDAISLLARDPNATPYQILPLINDIDIVTTAPPPVARHLCEKLAPELRQGGVWSPPFVEQFGVVLAGGKKAGLADSEGIDIACMKRTGIYDEAAVHPDTNEKAFPTTFGHDLLADAQLRDFCANALYYDPLNDVVVDPSTRGIADAENNLLHVVKPQRDHLAEPSLSARFYKFRLRGWETDGETLAIIRRHCQMAFLPKNGKQCYALTSVLGRVAPKDANTRAAVEAWLKQLEQVMEFDGVGDLFRKSIRGRTREWVIEQVLKRTRMGAGAPHVPAPAGGDA